MLERYEKKVLLDWRLLELPNRVSIYYHGEPAMARRREA